MVCRPLTLIAALVTACSGAPPDARWCIPLYDHMVSAAQCQTAAKAWNAAAPPPHPLPTPPLTADDIASQQCMMGAVEAGLPPTLAQGEACAMGVWSPILLPWWQHMPTAGGP